LDEAVERLEEARLKMEALRERPTSPDMLREWLEALTDYAFTFSEVHRFGNESIHEKLHFLASHAQLEGFPGDVRRTEHLDT
jgi:hypothetical protein